MAKKRKEEDFDTETTFADMNVEGFSWYDPAKKKADNRSGNYPARNTELWYAARSRRCCP